MPRDRYEQAKQRARSSGRSKSRRASAALRPRASQSAAWTAAILGSAIPITALLLYVVLGRSRRVRAGRARNGRAAPSTRSRAQDIEAMAEKLAARLENEPDNVDGWVMLARTY